MNSGFITQMKDKNGDSWYHQIVVETQQQEIERLNKDRNKLYENGLNDFLELQKKIAENERLENIIKEVREKIENTTINCDGVADDLIDDIYEMLNEENK